MIVDEGLDDDESEAPIFEFFVGEAGVAQPLDAANLEVREVVGVVDVPLRIYLRVADPEGRLADYGATGPGSQVCASGRRRPCPPSRPRWRRGGRTGRPRTRGRL